MLFSSTGDNWGEFNSYNKQHGENSPEEPARLSLYKRRSLSIKQASTSTPTCPQILESKMESEVSPIVNRMEGDGNNNKKELPVSVAHMKSLVEEAVKNEFSEKFNSFVNDMKYQFSSTNSQMRRMHLDMMMAMMKDFIKMENNMNSLREDLASNTPLSDNYLLEENLRLKKQIALLEERLSNTELEK